MEVCDLVQEMEGIIKSTIHSNMLNKRMSIFLFDYFSYDVLTGEFAVQLEGGGFNKSSDAVGLFHWLLCSLKNMKILHA